MPTLSISKSLYLRGLQCHKSLWLHKHRPELRDVSGGSREASFALGHRVGDLAKRLYPGGVEIEFDAKNLKGMLRKTQESIDGGQNVEKKK